MNRNIDALIFGALLFGTYLFLYKLNFVAPLNHEVYSNYTTRIWEWSQNLIGFSAFITFVLNWRMARPKNIIIGLILGIICALSLYSKFGNFSYFIVVHGITVALSFIGATIIFEKLKYNKVIEFRSSFQNMVYSIGFGIIVGIPFSAINIAYFYFSTRKIEISSLLNSAFLALNPGVSEEIIFRFFIIAVTLYFLKDIRSTRVQYCIAFFLGVIPHSLNHLPDLFLVKPYSAVILLVFTSIFFGLPMALLQTKKDLVSAISFHWFIDFTRFLLGY